MLHYSWVSSIHSTTKHSVSYTLTNRWPNMYTYLTEQLCLSFEFFIGLSFQPNEAWFLTLTHHAIPANVKPCDQLLRWPQRINQTEDKAVCRSHSYSQFQVRTKGQGDSLHGSLLEFLWTHTGKQKLFHNIKTTWLIQWMINLDKVYEQLRNIHIYIFVHKLCRKICQFIKCIHAQTESRVLQTFLMDPAKLRSPHR